ASDAAKHGIGIGAGKKDHENDEAIRRLFTPEFRNRLDSVIHFDGLPPEIVRSVVQKFIIQLEGQLSERNVTIEITDRAADWIARIGYDESFGARPLARIIQEKVKKPMADELLFGALKHGGLVKIDIDPNDDEKLAFQYFPEQPPAAPPPAKRPATA
ncbi:MAG: ATP-dependent Clp protease ATP-binding subunit ClpA, partial [Hyphomonadaceae bacterium]